MTTSRRWNLISARNRGLIGVAAVAGVGIAGAAILKAGDDDQKATIPAGTMIVGALGQTVSTKNAEPGDGVVITTTAPLEMGDQTIPSGVQLRGQVTYAKGGGRIAGAPELTMRFTRLDVDGHRYEVSAEPFRVKGTSDAKESAIEIAGGTVVGAVVGKATGSVVRGAVVGAAIGTGVAVLTKGDQIVLPAGQRLRVRLAEPVTVRYAPADKDA